MHTNAAVEKVIKVLEELVEQYAGRDMATYNTGNWLLEPIEKQNPEIQKAMLLLKELKNASKKNR